MSILATRNTVASAGVFVQTNELVTNRVLAFRRGEDGVYVLNSGDPSLVGRAVPAAPSSRTSPRPP